jgi:hypothetical protein
MFNVVSREHRRRSLIFYLSSEYQQVVRTCERREEKKKKGKREKEIILKIQSSYGIIRSHDVSEERIIVTLHVRTQFRAKQYAATRCKQSHADFEMKKAITLRSNVPSKVRRLDSYFHRSSKRKPIEIDTNPVG